MAEKKGKAKSKKAKDRIIEAAVDLMLESSDPTAITVRAIAERSRVGVGLINYHFGEKENLIREAARIFVSREVINGYGKQPPPGTTIRERAAALLRGPIEFLAAYPKLSRTSVLYDLLSPEPGDNSDVSFSEIRGALERVLAPDTRPADLGLCLWAAFGAIHEAFLRPERFKAGTGLDFSIVRDRAALADFLAGILLRDVNNGLAGPKPA
jgi:AcrR family transcriptional regulator